MYIDVSSYQGVIDWNEASKEENNIEGIILRSTTKNGNLDTRLLENYEKILKSPICSVNELSVYKMSYATNYGEAKTEAEMTIKQLGRCNILYDRFYLDLENRKGNLGDFTTKEADEVITAYYDAFYSRQELKKLRLYMNYNYLKNIIRPIWHNIPIWLARYNSTMGDVNGANVVLWQYTSEGKCAGIKGNVDISKRV